MRKCIKKIAWLCVISLFTSGYVYAQQTINVTGGSKKIQGIIHEYSIGEMVLISTQKSGNMIVTQGVLQPTSGKSAAVNHISSADVYDAIKVYPNPTSSTVNIQSSDANITQAKIFDASGKILQDKEILNGNVAFDLSTYTPGNYFIILSGNNATQKLLSYKIQKIK